MSKVALLIGGNQGDRRALLEQAVELIRQRIGSAVAISKVYQTAPWGDFGGAEVPDFLNQALVVETTLSPHQVLRKALAIEAELGRVRNSELRVQSSELRKYHSRPMDIDLILYDNLVIDTAELTLPHPRMHLRQFVLEPLAEIVPDWRHPLLDKTMGEMLYEVRH